MNPALARYIGIDYSGAHARIELEGLRVYADRLTVPQEVMRPSPRKYWTRRGIAEWLVERLSEGQPMLVGIDHGFSFPLRYFEQHGLPLDWSSFLVDFQSHWPTDEVSMSEDMWKNGREWHLEFKHAPDFPYPFPIVPAETRPKRDAVGHLSADGRVHVFNAGIIEKLVRAGLSARV